jgi:hypothetical protein
MSSSAPPNASPRSRNTSRVIFHSPSPVHSTSGPFGVGLSLSLNMRPMTASAGLRPAVSPNTYPTRRWFLW